MGNYYGRLVCFVFAVCCCLAIISLVSFAFASTAGEYIPRDVRYRQAGMANFQRMAVQYDLDKAGFTQQKWAQQFPNNKSLPVEYSKPSVANMAKNAGRATAWGVATLAAIAAAGWAIDELTNQVVQTEMVPNSDPFTIPQDFYRWRIVSPYDISADTPQSLINLIGAYPSDNASIVFESSSRVRFRLYYIDSILYNSFFANRESCESCQYDPVLVPVQNPVPQSQVDDAFYDAIKNLPAHKVESGFKNQHNQPAMTPELDQALQDWYQELADRDPNLSYDPSTKTFTYNDPETGETTQEQVDNSTATGSDSESNTQVKGSDWPVFCDWATIVCDLASFIMDEPEVPEPMMIPFEDVNLADIHEDFDSGLGSGSCPAPQTATFQGEQIVYSFDTACMAAQTFFKPVLLVTASIIAGFIIVGASRKGV